MEGCVRHGSRDHITCFNHQNGYTLGQGVSAVNLESCSQLGTYVRFERESVGGGVRLQRRPVRWLQSRMWR